MKFSGVSSSITPWATITRGQRAPQAAALEPGEAKAHRAGLGDRPSAQADQTIAAINPSAASSPRLCVFPIPEALFTMVGGDGLEPPTLSV